MGSAGNMMVFTFRMMLLSGVVAWFHGRESGIASVVNTPYVKNSTEIVNLINSLRDHEGTMAGLCRLEGLEGDCAVVCADWTRWAAWEFPGADPADALRNAISKRDAIYETWGEEEGTGVSS